MEKQSFRNFSKTTHKFGSKRLKGTLHHLTGITKKKISLETSEAKQGALEHDRWTMSGVHCVGLFGCYLILKKI